MFRHITVCLLLVVFALADVRANATEIVTFAPHTFTIPDGYELKLVAAPPLVQRPIHMGFDVNGVLYVTDSSGNTDKAPLQLKTPEHRVLRLIDHDGDGVFDESSVFADQLPFPEGILIHEGDVYIGAPPHIWRLRDTDGDHVADQRTVWFDGGSIEKCGNDMHGPYLGPDGYFYWCKGAFAAQEHDLSNGKTLQSRAAHIYRAKPDGSQLEMVITGGMNNPVGLAFSQAGERFLSGTFFDLSQPGRRDGILHAIYGGTYGRKNERVLAPLPNTGDLLPVLAQLGPAAPSGMVMPRHPASDLNGDLICTEFNTRRLSRHRLTPMGSTYSATTSTLLESDQTDFHPTDVIEDADGSLLVADTGSWYMICCPTSKIAKPDVLGAIYRIQKKTGSQLADPRGLELDWNRPQIDWLFDERPAVVQRATDVMSNPSHLEALETAAKNAAVVWSLHRIPGEEARAAVRACLKSEIYDVRLAALHSASLWRDRGAFDILLELLSDEESHTQRLAAMALGRIGDREAVESLLDAWSDKIDPFLKHAILHALFEIGDLRSLPTGHPLNQQVQRMRQIDQQNLETEHLFEIQLARVKEPDRLELARQKQRLDELTSFLPQGDVNRGAKLFSNMEKARCTLCHLKGDNGIRLGPDLTWIGAIRDERDLLEAIVFPSATIARYHEVVHVETKDGNQISGLLVKDTADTLFLSPADGVVHSVSIQDIEVAQYSDVSLMPEGIDKILTPEEIADLVAYLKASRPPTKISDGGK